MSKARSNLKPQLSWKVHISVFLVCGVAMILLLHVHNHMEGVDSDPWHVQNSLIWHEFPEQKWKKSKIMVYLRDNSFISSSQVMATKTKSEQCPIQSISKLTEEERYPLEGKRHMITPPQGGLMHLVCCQSTQGPFSILVHEQWAPRGAKRFVDMVQRGYFSAGVPLFWCLKGFICQFGLNSNPKLSEVFQDTIPDDLNWLPGGPKYKRNAKGVKRFARGYFAYAGNGEGTRNNQFIVSLDNVEPLGGGSPWEVPWGELVGNYSFETFSKVYTKYADKGPSQETLWRRGVSEEVRTNYPKMDYITACSVVDQDVQVWE